MTIPPIPQDFIDATNKILNADCPRFPKTSIFIGRIASWALESSSWMGLPLGAAHRVLWALKMRGWMVGWSRTPYVERLLCMGIVGAYPAAVTIAASRSRSRSAAAA